jgi:ketosteroid isomerase-like protein
MDPLSLTKSILAAFARGDVAAILEHLAEDVEWECGLI